MRPENDSKCGKETPPVLGNQLRLFGKSLHSLTVRKPARQTRIGKMLIPSDWNGFTWQFNGFYTLNGHNLSFINLGCNPSKLGWSVGVLEYWKQ